MQQFQEDKYKLTFCFVFADSKTEWNCSEWRCSTPTRTINSRSNHRAFMMHVSEFVKLEDERVREQVGWADVIFFQRNAIDPPAWRAIDYWQGLGRPVLLDLDDAYPILPHANPAHNFWIRNAGGLAPLIEAAGKETQMLQTGTIESPVEALEKGVRMCDGMTSPSKLICRDWESHNYTFWLPNFAQGEWWRDVKPRRPDGRIVIGWGGSYSHYDSWWFSNLRPALERVAKLHPEVQVVVGGSQSENCTQLAIAEDSPLANRLYQPLVPAMQWPQVVATFDIGLAPLAGEYDQRRSWIKALEYMLGGVPWIGTAGWPYRELSAWGRLVENTEDEWFSALEECIRDLPRRKERALLARAEAEKLTMENNTNWYAKLAFQVLDLKRAKKITPGVTYVNMPGKGGRFAAVGA